MGQDVGEWLLGNQCVGIKVSLQCSLNGVDCLIDKMKFQLLVC